MSFTNIVIFLIVVFIIGFCIFKGLQSLYRKIFKRNTKVEIKDFNEEEYGFNDKSLEIFTSETLKDDLKHERKRQVADIKSGYGIVCHTNWEISGSKSQGNKMTQNSIKLTAIAFNNQCDAIIAKVNWKNFDASRKKIVASCNTINRLNEENTIEISSRYLEMKIKELQLTHLYEEKKQKEKEEQAEIKAQMREDQKAQKELEDAVADENKFTKALLAAKKKFQSSSNEEKKKLKEQIKLLMSQLEKTKRAKSMAQQTRSGHVYVISNEGSFGKDVFKIGMTRRLEPQDRVKELGDASVPFTFDVHAMIYSKDAPKLEKELHKVFDDNRVNKVNKRKEFFKVSLLDIKKEVEKRDSSIKFIIDAEAKDYRLSQ